MGPWDLKEVYEMTSYAMLNKDLRDYKLTSDLFIA